MTTLACLCRRCGERGHLAKRCGRARASGINHRDVRTVARVTAARLGMDPLGIARSTFLVNDRRPLRAPR